MNSNIDATVAIIPTGGTAGSIMTKDGIQPGSARDVKNLYLKYLDSENVPNLLISYVPDPNNSRNILFQDSTNRTRAEEIAITKVVFDHLSVCRGVVVVGGSDTQAFLASGMTFSLGHVEKTIVLMAAARNIDHRNTDIPQALRDSVTYALNGYPGIFVVSVKEPGISRVMEAPWIYEVRSGGDLLDYFDSVVGDVVTIKDGVIIPNRKPVVEMYGDANITPPLKRRIASIKVTPTTKAKDLRDISSRFDAIVLETPNMGVRENLLQAVTDIASKKLVVLTSSTPPNIETLVQTLEHHGGEYRVQMEALATGVIRGTGLSTMDFQNLVSSIEQFGDNRQKIIMHFYNRNVRDVTKNLQNTIPANDLRAVLRESQTSTTGRSIQPKVAIST